jgi:hypothetical protein
MNWEALVLAGLNACQRLRHVRWELGELAL